MPRAPICLFTSIRPPADTKAASYLRDCLRSWRAAGFDAVAVNGPAETEALRDLELPIEFAVTSTEGKPASAPFFRRSGRADAASPASSTAIADPLAVAWRTLTTCSRG